MKNIKGDLEYFDDYKKSFENIFSSNPSDAAYLLDSDLKYQAMTQAMLSIIGVDLIEDIIGKTPAEVAIKFNSVETPKHTEIFSKQWEALKKTRQTGLFLEILPYKGVYQAHIAAKTPFVNPDTNNFLGVRVQINNLVWPHAIKTLLKLHGSKGLLLTSAIKRSRSDYNLNEMQHMVLFLCLNNYSYSEIALLLNEFGHSVSPIRVNDYLEQLKLIFHVRSKTQLIEKAIGLNFHLCLPRCLFSICNSLEFSHELAIISQ